LSVLDIKFTGLSEAGFISFILTVAFFILHKLIKSRDTRTD
jgi:hypothetical protein